MKKPKYQTELHVEGGADGNDRKNVNMPIEIYDTFISMAYELEFQSKGKASVIAFLRAISELDLEVVEGALSDADLMPKRSNSFDRLWD